MLGRLLGSTDLKQLASFASPAFFDVMPTRGLVSAAKRLHAGSRDPEAMRHARAHRQATLLQAELPVTLSEKQPGTISAPTLGAGWRAGLVVEIYFHQLLTGGPMLLDLRDAAFSAQPASRDDGRFVWHPSAWVTELAPEFLSGIRGIYHGFYTADEVEFRSALSALDLLEAEDVFREQFGSDVHAVAFRMPDFVSTFHEVFVRCKRAGRRLHPDFLFLGIELAALYQHLEKLGVQVDVARCFERAWREKSAR